MKRTLPEEPSTTDVTWFWTDSKGSHHRFSLKKSHKIETAFKQNKTTQFKQWTILGLEGVHTGPQTHRLVRVPSTSPYDFTVSPQDITAPESWNLEKLSFSPEKNPAGQEMVPAGQEMVPYYFSRSGEKGRWCPFADGERNEYTEKLYELFKRERVDCQWDYDKMSMLMFEECKVLVPTWCFFDSYPENWIDYTEEQSRVIEEAWKNKRDFVIVDVENPMNGKRCPYKVDFKAERQYPVDNPGRYRRIKQKVEERKLLRVMVGWFWLEDEKKNIWKPYSQENTRIIEEAYTSNQSSVWITIRTDGPFPSETKYKINLVRMEQNNVNKVVPDQYIPQNTDKKSVHHAWIRKVRRYGPRMKNREQIEYPSHSIALPIPYTQEPPTSISPVKKVPFFTLDPTDEMWKTIENFMHESFIPDYRRKYGCIPGTTEPPARFEVIKIDRIESSALDMEYRNKKLEISRQGFSNADVQDLIHRHPLKLGEKSIIDDSINEFFLFHGTKNKFILPIAEDGFSNRSVLEFISERPYNGMFGSGTYFAEHSSKSNQYVDCPNCEKGALGCVKPGTKEFDPCRCSPEEVEKKGGYVMILAKVLLGDPHICTHRDYQESLYKSKMFPPNNKDSIWAEPPEPDFKGVNTAYGISNREFISFEPANVYPAYLIYYLRK